MNAVNWLGLLVPLLPPLIFWWRGRALAPMRDDPAFPERLLELRRRSAQFGVVCVGIGTVMSGGMSAVIVIALVGAIAAEYPLRRDALGERIGLVPYVFNDLRLALALWGFWFFLAAAPGLVGDAGPARVWAAIALGGMLVAWSLFFPDVFRWLTGASSLARPDLEPYLAPVVRAATVTPPPRLYVAGALQGGWINAFALSSRRAMTVVFGARLLTLFKPAEVAAILAHELAHLEHYTPKRLLRLEAAHLGAIALAVFVLPFGLAPIPRFRTLLVLWPAAVVVFVLMRLAAHRSHEAESDRRAIMLCGDGEALVGALVKLHVAMGLPRRWAPEVERWASHPSLARRIQSIRAAAGTSPTSLAAPSVIAAAVPGVFILFEDEHVTWLEGVAAGTPPEPAALRERAATVRSVRYAELSSLRVQARLWGSPSLAAVDQQGRSWSVPISGAAAVQSALDAVDARLAPGLVVPHRRWLPTVLCVVIALTLLITRYWGVALLPTLAGILGGGPPALAALTATLLAEAAIYSFRPDGPGVRAVALLAILATMCGALVWQRLASRHADDTARSWKVRAVTGLLTIAAVVAALGMISSVLTGAGALRLQQAARQAASVSVLLFGVAATLMMVQARWARLGAGVALLGVMLVPALGSAWFRDHFAQDPFLAPTRPLAWSRTEAPVLRSLRLDGEFSDLRVAPSGRRFAARADVDDAASTFAIGGFAGQRREILALDLHFVSDAELLLLAPGGATSELRMVPSDAPDTPSWRLPLPRLASPHFAVDADTRVWQLVGRDRRAGTVRVLRGTIGRGDVEETQFAARDRGGIVGSPHGAIAVDARFEPPLIPWTLTARGTWRTYSLGPAPLPPRTDVHLLSADGPPRVVRSDLDVRCLPPRVTDETFTCLAWDGTRTQLWSVPPHGSWSLLAVVSGRMRHESLGAGGHLAAVAANDEALVLLGPGHLATRITSPELAPDEVVAGSGWVATLEATVRSTTVTVLDVSSPR